MKVVTVPGQTYVVYAAEGTTITAPGVKDPLLTCEGGKPNYVTVPGSEMEISDPEATYAACRNFERALAVLGLHGGGANSGLPAGFSRVEFLTSAQSYIKTPHVPTEDTGLFVKTYQTHDYAYGAHESDNQRFYFQSKSNSRSYGYFSGLVALRAGNNQPMGSIYEGELNWLNSKRARMRHYKWDESYDVALPKPVNPITMHLQLFSATPNLSTSNVTFWEAKISQNKSIVHDFVPSLDQTGAPCMFDIVTQTPFYSDGSGDFVYKPNQKKVETAAWYKKIQYLTCDGNQYVDIPHNVDSQTGFSAEFEGPCSGGRGAVVMAIGEPNNAIVAPFAAFSNLKYAWGGALALWKSCYGRHHIKSSINFLADGKVDVTTNDAHYEEALSVIDFTSDTIRMCYSVADSTNYATYAAYNGNIYRITISQGTEIIHDFYPYVDSNGVGCLYDEIEKKPYYSWREPFIVEAAALLDDDAPVATTYSLRAPRQFQYAQMTEHGIRRLYHVPKGYNGTKDEYAAEHGFKVLVETEKPEEGYWTPQWKETEDTIELDWIEAEPPAEELLTEA